MIDSTWAMPSLSYNALYLFAWLRQRHGSARIKPLLRWSGLMPDDLCQAADELQARGWIDVAWRSPRFDLPERLREVDRLTISRQGRRFGPRRWLAGPLAPPVRSAIATKL
jgi:hypothetical protein